MSLYICLFENQAIHGTVTVSCTVSSARSCTFATSTSMTTRMWRAGTHLSWPGLLWPGWTAGYASQRRPLCLWSPSLWWSPWWQRWWWLRGTGRGTVERTGTQSHRRKLRAHRLPERRKRTRGRICDTETWTQTFLNMQRWLPWTIT